MNKLSKHSLVTAALLVLIPLSSMAALPAPSQTPTTVMNRIVATVNDDIITQSDWDHATRLIEKRYRLNHQKMPNAAALKKQALTQLINQNMLLQLAKKNHLTVTDAQVSQAIQRMASGQNKTVAALEKDLPTMGFTNMAAFKKQLRREILIDQMESHAVRDTIIVNPDEIQSMKASLKAKHPAQYHIVDLLIPLSDNSSINELSQATKTAQAILKNMHSGATLAAIHQQFPKVDTQDLGWRSQSQLPSLFEDQLTTLIQKKYVGPLHASNGLHILKLVATHNNAEHLSDLQVQQILFQQKFQTAANKWVKSIRETANIQVLVTP